MGCRSHFDILEELRAFEAAFVSELNAGAAERAEAKKRKAQFRAEEEAAATVRRRQEQEEWLEGEWKDLPGELTFPLVPSITVLVKHGAKVLGLRGCSRIGKGWLSNTYLVFSTFLFTCSYLFHAPRVHV